MLFTKSAGTGRKIIPDKSRSPPRSPRSPDRYPRATASLSDGEGEAGWPESALCILTCPLINLDSFQHCEWPTAVHLSPHERERLSLGQTVTFPHSAARGHGRTSPTSAWIAAKFPKRAYNGKPRACEKQLGSAGIRGKCNCFCSYSLCV